MLALLGIIIGLLIGLFMNVDIPRAYSPYVAIVIVAALDSLIGALLANLQKRFSIRIFVTGIIGNSVIALSLTALGERLSLDLNLAAVFAFTIRMINNFSAIRRLWLSDMQARRRQRRSLAGRVETHEAEPDEPDHDSQLGQALPGAKAEAIVEEVEARERADAVAADEASAGSER